MIKFDKNEFLKPQIYSTLNEYETRCNVTKEIIEEIEQLQQENKILRENAEHNDKVVDKVNWENQLLKKENKQLKDNWNKLKEWLEEYIKTNEKWYSSELSNHDKEYYKKDYIDCKFWLMKFQNQMQEIEGGMNG